MAVARTRTVLIGTDETTGTTITNNSNTITSERDWAGNDTSAVELVLYLKFTSTVTAGTVDVTIFPRQISGGADFDDVSPLKKSYAPINGTQTINVGRFWVGRYGTVQVLNNATGASITNTLLVEERFVYS